ncbi:hypothetical protein BDY19DRAFT_969625 [Irpex rosettiformis]|uniref:Uncharacterized protein n=1 Tax=Irpex rosettiformis TaxID=378272 RepID=A0ACB8TRM1_9APHY|nr:hypothetical protein BDY19DRAFT_969625 [Irpex rosettiformis]
MADKSSDAASELLIARLLEDDLRLFEEAAQLEQAQLEQSLRDSALLRGKIPKRTFPVAEPNDVAIALTMLAADVRMNSDAAYAQALQHSDDVASIASRQYAQQLLAAEKKIALDAEFAKRLQRLEDNEEVDDDRIDAEAVLGKGEIERILAENPNEKGKGKAPGLPAKPDIRPKKQVKVEEEDVLMEFVEPQQFKLVHPTCGICLEEFQLVHSPINASNVHKAASSTKLPFGLQIPCPGNHPYCQACLTQYIRSKVDPSNDGSGNIDTIVFPIRCPGCPITTWKVGITDDIAARVLSEKAMVTWHHQKLLDSLPRIYCPNKKCSTLVQAHEDPNEPQAQCPACNMLMCVPCRVLWHEDMTCEEFQALPLDERSPEDQQALQLMRAQHWRRCPQCQIIVELEHGCNHITCRCGTHFCFKCGAKWDTEEYQCTRVPSCDTWDEDMLLEEQERRREAAPAPPPRQEPHRLNPHRFVMGEDVMAEEDERIHRPAPPPPYYAQHLDAGRPQEMHWIMEPETLKTRHWFTLDMVTNLTCGYCSARLNSLADLRYHLSRTKKHEVYACCGRFFKRAMDFDRHVGAGRSHENQVSRG